MPVLKKFDPVEFDPTIEEHRHAVRAFMKRKAWVDSPFRFKHDPSYGSVSNQVQTKLLHWYMNQEESKELKKTERKGAREKTRKDNVKFISPLGSPGVGKSAIVRNIAPANAKELAFNLMGIASEFNP